MSPRPRDSEPGGHGAAPIRTLAELQRLVQGKDAFDVLQVLLEGDPLRLQERCRRWLDADARLLDPGLLARRSIGQVASRVESIAEDGAIDAWLAPAFEAAAWSVMLEEEEAAQRDEVLPEPLEARYRFFSISLSIEPAGLRRACVAYNGLPEIERRAAYAMLVRREGFSLFAERHRLKYEKAKDIMVQAIAKILEAGKGDGRG